MEWFLLLITVSFLMTNYASFQMGKSFPRPPRCPNKPECDLQWGELESVTWVDPGEGSIGPQERSSCYQRGKCTKCGRIDSRRMDVR